MQSLESGYLVLTNIPEREWSFRIERRRIVLGRSPKADIPIPGRFRGVSRRHAELWVDRYGAWVRDLGSKLGTKVNGVWVDRVPQANLVVGDRIWFGGVEADVVSEVSQLAYFTGDPEQEDLPTSELLVKVLKRRSLAHQLSRAEIELLLWLSRGYQNNTELSKCLHRSPHTIRTQISSIFQKLNLHSRAEILGWLRRTSPLLPAPRPTPLHRRSILMHAPGLRPGER